MNRRLLLVVLAGLTALLLALVTLPANPAALAQNNPTSNPIVETAVAMTLTAFNRAKETPTLTIDQQVEATVSASLRKKVWIEDAEGERHPFMDSIPDEIKASSRATADVWVIIKRIETEVEPLTVTGGCGGKITRYQVDLDIQLVDRVTGAVLDSTVLEGYTPTAFFLTSCNPLRGVQGFAPFFHWLALRVYLVATPTPTFTPSPTVTPTPTP